MNPTTQKRLSVAIDLAAQALGARTPLQRTILRTLVQEVIRICDLDRIEPAPRPSPPPAPRAERSSGAYPAVRPPSGSGTHPGFPPPPSEPYEAADEDKTPTRAQLLAKSAEVRERRAHPRVKLK